MGDINKDTVLINAELSIFDKMIKWLLGIMLLLMPYAFGVVHAWSEEIVILLSGMILICFLLKVIYRGQTIVWTWAYVPVALFILLIILQLIPLPYNLVKVISPNTAALKTELLSIIPNGQNSLQFITLSLYPYATIHNLRLVISLAAVFFVILNLYRQPQQIKNLLLFIAFIGGTVALLTFCQQVFGNGKIFWFISSKNTNGDSGPFVCHSHYGQFMNLSIGAAIGWLCIILHEKFYNRKLKPADIINYLSSGSSRPIWLIVIIMSIGAATVFISLTRGGMLSMLAAAGFTTILIASRKSLASSGWIMVLMALAAFVCIIYVGFDAVYERFATLGSLSSYNTRLQIIKDLTSSLGRFPIFGTGLGTHASVYPMFQSVKTTLLFTHAENEYIQILAETGFLGFLLLAAFGTLILKVYFKNIRNGNSHINFAIYGLGFGLFAILIHSMSDFGQHLPANSFLSVIFCGLLISISKGVSSKANIPSKVRKKSPLFVVILLVIISGTWVWALIGANNARIAESQWSKVVDIEKGLANKNWKGTEQEYDDLISFASRAAKHQPLNSKYRYWYNVFRWYSITKTTAPMLEDGDIIREQSLPIAKDIASELSETIILCPTFGPAYSLLGRIETYVFYDENGPQKIRMGFELAPCNAIACLESGRLDVIRGNSEESISKFQKAIEIDARLYREVVNIYIHYLSRPDLAIEAAEGNLSRLRYVKKILNEMQYYDLVEAINTKQLKLLEKKCTAPGAGARDFEQLADIYKMKEENEKAIEYYRQALNLDYGSIGSRIKLAKLLANNNQIDEAMSEARICLRLRPQYNSAKKLIEDLSVNSASFSKNNN